ncbi:hypothetical protein OAJ60_05955, partial [Planctomycetaceae bacterium]|nr:hypothetical protein [Planctomycetaceae bacterium]
MRSVRKSTMPAIVPDQVVAARAECSIEVVSRVARRIVSNNGVVENNGGIAKIRNTTSFMGGGIYVGGPIGSVATLSIEATSMIGNSTKYSGGALYAAMSTTISNSTFSD